MDPFAYISAHPPSPPKKEKEKKLVTTGKLAVVLNQERFLPFYVPLDTW